MKTGRGRTLLMGAALLMSAAAAGCLKAEAKTPGPEPSLTTPDPPARVLIPVPSEALAAPPTPTPEPTPVGPPVRTPPKPTPTATPTPTPMPTATPTPVETPPPILQTASNMAQLESQAKASMERAQKDLDRLKRDALAPDAQDSYDSARRYIRQAQQAIQDKNYPLAKACADKAAIIASLLVK